VPEFTLTVNGTTYGLGLDANPELRKRAEQFNGQTVIVTGTLSDGDLFKHVAVTGLKADSSIKTFVRVEIKGKLIRGKRYFTGMYIGNARGSWPVYHYAWSIQIGQDTYHLDLVGGMVQHWVAETLSGKTVIVIGTLVGDRVKVASLKEDRDRVQKTTVVEVRGKLAHRRLADSSYPHSKDIMCLRQVWIVEAEGKTYELDFSKGLPLSIARLEGKTVVVSGTLTGHRIVVTELKPDNSGAARQTVNVEAQGKLCQDQNGAWKVAVEGTLYTLEFGASKELSRRASRNRGANVVIRGTLKDGVITVRDMEFPSGEWVLVSKDGGSKVPRGYIQHVLPAMF
jgi:hypothetical protein